MYPYELLIKRIKPLTVGLQLSVQIAYQIIDVFKLRSGLKTEMLIDMYFDTGGTEWQQTSSTAAEVSQQFVIMKGTSNFGQLWAILVVGMQQTCSHSINNCYYKCDIYVVSLDDQRGFFLSNSPCALKLTRLASVQRVWASTWFLATCLILPANLSLVKREMSVKRCFSR